MAMVVMCGIGESRLAAAIAMALDVGRVNAKSFEREPGAGSPQRSGIRNASHVFLVNRVFLVCRISHFTLHRSVAITICKY
ncbi:hypothetical protein AUEXF2481DRAFT_152544 [Aureobasidium subglaciale EXF-2481]|uniref:Uncharacterized protein n=1 Tax=Aureobasidium subglaciale (strain EXF-2481) TaxID=1043005 RepID=A0A074YX26_AURSE|nr:uncharacterized protein AUEXF2481DRAFT_152544 [Aureobasidium subglaciale EXF-2481]KER00695.1 hypothetical protein AUEXF2481DRAFT_152544 [Aureobasidium subglaciale EXF-2481]